MPLNWVCEWISMEIEYSKGVVSSGNHIFVLFSSLDIKQRCKTDHILWTRICNGICDNVLINLKHKIIRITLNGTIRIYPNSYNQSWGGINKMHPKVTTDNIIYSEYTWKLGKQERFDLEVDFELVPKYGGISTINSLKSPPLVLRSTKTRGDFKLFDLQNHWNFLGAFGAKSQILRKQGGILN